MQQGTVHKHHLHEIRAAEAGAAKQRHAQLLPDDMAEVGKLHLVERECADHGGARLRAAVAARAGEHRNEGIEHNAGRQSRFVMVEDDAGEGRREHEDEQPRDTRLPRFQYTGLEIGLVRGQHGRHLFEVLRGLLLHDVDGVVNGDDADEPVFLIDDRQSDEVVL